MQTPRNTFKKHERLSGKTAIDELFQKGKWLSGKQLRIVYLQQEFNKACPARILVSVPKKFFKSAVQRNLIKRRIREAYRLHKNHFFTELKKQQISYHLAVIYSTDKIMDYKEIEEELLKVLNKI